MSELCETVFKKRYIAPPALVNIEMLGGLSVLEYMPDATISARIANLNHVQSLAFYNFLALQSCLVVYLLANLLVI